MASKEEIELVKSLMSEEDKDILEILLEDRIRGRMRVQLDRQMDIIMKSVIEILCMKFQFSSTKIEGFVEQYFETLEKNLKSELKEQKQNNESMSMILRKRDVH